MRRQVALAVLALVTACPVTTTFEEGGLCRSEGAGACNEDGGTLLQCVSGTWSAFADCRGPRGCERTADTADCDTSGDSVGDRCPPTSEGRVRCDPDAGLNVLRCVGGRLIIELECPGGSTCALTDAGLTCVF
jgi:hypothetical protein